MGEVVPPIPPKQRPYRVFAYCTNTRIGEDGGGVAVIVGRFGSLATATKAALERLTAHYDPPAFNRVQVQKPGEHPWWYYLDGDGRVCMWRLRPQDKRQAWGFCGG